MIQTDGLILHFYYQPCLIQLGYKVLEYLDTRFWIQDFGEVENRGEEKEDLKWKFWVLPLVSGLRFFASYGLSIDLFWILVGVHLDDRMFLQIYVEVKMMSNVQMLLSVTWYLNAFVDHMIFLQLSVEAFAGC